tara:strand:+ start:2727 stop:3704 length:978 start_codon:yes stop_codon:yes gene_type:complete
MFNPFFKNKGPFRIHELLKLIQNSNKENYKNIIINNIRDLHTAKIGDISFFHNKKYTAILSQTKASACLTTKNLSHLLPVDCLAITVDNVLFATAKITKLFYPNAVNDNFDQDAVEIDKTFFANIKTGKNVLTGNNVQIGKNCFIGHNTIIESNVIIGDDCSVGSNVILRNTIIKNNVSILDNCTIGKKGFGFFPDNNKNFRYPHIGVVIIEDNCEIGCGTTIDRGSLSNTTIGKNTYLDNHVHIAHNNIIGNNCIIAGQVGFAGSSILGDNVMIGGQAGISGHLRIGNNVQIAGGSGVIKNIPNNSRVMGYPAKDLKSFIKENK